MIEKRKGLKYTIIPILIFLLNLPVTKALSQPIIVDHTSVDKYQDIPEYYINEVKKMWIVIAGESHSGGYRAGCNLLEQIDGRYSVNVTEAGIPEGYTDQHLRISRGTWGDHDNSTGWIYDYGEEDFFTNQTAIQRTKNGLAYCNNNGFQLSVFGFGWCWDMEAGSAAGGIDPEYHVRWAGWSDGGADGSKGWGLDSNDSILTGNRVNMAAYINAVEQYRNLCETNNFSTVISFTTGPVEYDEENGYQRQLKHEYIRNYVQQSENAVLFDFADFLSYNDAGQQNLSSWTDHNNILHTFQYLHNDNRENLDGSYTDTGYHFGEIGAVRLAKALWYMLARIAGWNGLPVGTDTEAPTVPANLQGIALSVTSAQLSWTASTDNVGVTGYRIYRNGSAIVTSATTTYTDNGLTVGNTYSYTVTSFDAAGNESNHSLSVIVNTIDQQAPTIPLNLQGIALSVTSARLTWDASSDNVGVKAYRIYRNGVSLGSKTKTIFYDFGLIAGNTYTYFITAFDAAGNVSNPSQTVTLITRDLQAPTAPANLQGIALSTTRAQLTWNISTDNIGVTGYRIYRNGIIIDSSVILTFTDNGLTIGNSYIYFVTAYDAEGNESNHSQSVTINTNDQQAPTIPSNLQGIALSVTSARLTWDASSDNVGVKAYRIYRNGVSLGSKTKTIFYDFSLIAGNTYTYFITAFDAAGNVSGPSASVLINTDDLKSLTVQTDLPEIGLSEVTTLAGIDTLPSLPDFYKLRIFPNPSNGIFETELPEKNGEYCYFLFSVNGVLLENNMISVTNNRVSMERSDLKAGLYIINIICDKHIYSGKIQVIK